MKIFRILYTSQCSDKITDESQILEIVEKARENNTSLGITGMLLYIGDKFIQVLEGDEDKVRDLFMKIAADNRHQFVKRVLEGHVKERQFSSWTMGYRILTPQDLEDLKMINRDSEFNVESLLDNKDNFAIQLMQNFYKHGTIDFNSFWTE